MREDVQTNNDYSLIVESNPAVEDSDFIRGQLLSFNAKHVGSDNHETLSVFARGNNGKLVAGLLGGTYWNWLHLEFLWVQDGLRRKGMGSSLLAAAESAARERGCRHAHVETHDFQSPEFYLKHGYEVFASLDDLPVGHRKMFLKKRL
jgi:GNAT superfamily N-acetyltransferase